MWQAGTVVTRCSLHVRLVPSEPRSRTRAGGSGARERGAPIDAGLSGKGNSLVARCARFDSADRLHPLAGGAKEIVRRHGPFVFW